MSFRRKLTLALVPVLLGAGLTLTSAAPSSAAVTCSYSYNQSTERAYAGHYTGLTAQPSKTVVTSAGAEAQCLLKSIEFSPGTIDGVFGPNSQGAMRAFQQFVNRNYDAGIAEDGMCGPESWPWLRNFAYWDWRAGS
ncbi:peptidoglycan-binding protein [Streptomyces sp. NPDC091376]|uniref:peptidoglycan-binding domain-containing protein n=1 Tax=Streptomyces sp. NPDC091376 TaxID=3365994 RepID=UPI00380FF211